MGISGLRYSFLGCSGLMYKVKVYSPGGEWSQAPL